MWAAIRWLVLRIVAARWLFKLGGLAFLLPLAMLLKTIGLPLLGVLAILALPILILLFLFGLPIFLVLVVGGLFMGMIGVVLTIGLAAFKIGLFVVLPIWLIWMLFSKLFRRGGTNGGTNGATSPDTSTGPTPPGPTDTVDDV